MEFGYFLVCVILREMRENLRRFLNSFFALPFGEKAVRIPYWRNRFLKLGRRIQGPFGGKGSPSEIRRATVVKLRQAGLNWQKMSAWEIRRFMEQKRIGLDCSGFAFQILNFLRPGFWQGLQWAPGLSHNPRRRLNAWALTNKKNSIFVEPLLNKICEGDIIPAQIEGEKKIDHVLVIVGKDKKEVIYAHSSNRTEITGPHLGVIKIIAANLPLWQQIWPEKLKTGQPLLMKVHGPLEKIGIRRLRPFVIR